MLGSLLLVEYQSSKFVLFSFTSSVQKKQTMTSDQSVNEKHQKEIKFCKEGEKGGNFSF
jgi:hypothetical protein